VDVVLLVVEQLLVELGVFAALEHDVRLLVGRGVHYYRCEVHV